MTLSAAVRLAAVEQCLRDEDTPEKDLLERALAVDAHESLASFVQQLWPVLEPATPLEWTWFLDLLCRELEAVTAGETRDLLICVPPGTMKSLLTSVFWLSWWWLRNPAKRHLTLSGSDSVATRDSWKMRQVVTSEWYGRLRSQVAAIYGVPDWGLSKDQNQKVNFVNTEMGSRQCFSTGGSIMGNRGDGYLVDDPHQIDDVIGTAEHVANALGAAHDKIDIALPTRVNDQRTAWRVLILQRVHQDDAAARFLARGYGRAVILPMHAFPLDHPWRHPDDPREPGELLDPVRLDEERVRRLAEQLESRGPGQARAQFEQQPVPPGGAMFARAWMAQRYEWDPQRPATPYDEVVVTIDATFKATKRGSFVSIQVWGRKGWIAYYLLDEVHARIGYLDTKQALRDLEAKWRPAAILIEDAANGPALLDELKREFPAVIGITAVGDKVARATSCTPMWQGGGVWLPPSAYAPWISDWCNEVCSFPGGTDKDRVDAMAQLFRWWAERRGTTSLATKNANLRGLLTRLGR